MPPPYGARLKTALELRKMTASGASRELAARGVKLSQQGIDHLARHGKGSKHTAALAEALGVSASWLAYGLGEMEAKAGEIPTGPDAEWHSYPLPLKAQLIATVQAARRLPEEPWRKSDDGDARRGRMKSDPLAAARYRRKPAA